MSPDRARQSGAPTHAIGIGDRIGAYTIVALLGEGGFGSVFLADQSVPIRRRVALKLLKTGLHSSEIVRRFEAERQALAVMEHPSIAKVYDAGTTDGGLPYFVMEHVEGLPITRHCDERGLSTTERLNLFREVCRGVQHAHQKGVIHRDIKPSNVMVTQIDGVDRPKIIDFGIAKALESNLIDDSVVTQARQILGTPEYMAPEQADARGDIDTRADVYSLGVLLYQLLTGTKPFEMQALIDSGIGELLKHIREFVPPKPSTRVSTLEDDADEVATKRSVTPARLRRALRGDLDWIVMKALEKERDRRYSTASEFADDIGRFLKNQPVHAGPPSAAYRFSKFARRNKALLAAAIVVASCLFASLAVLAWSLRRVSAQRDIAQAARASAEASLDESDAVTDFLAGMLRAADPRADGRDVKVRTLLDRASEDIGKQFAGRPRAETRLRRTLADTYRNLGLLEQAETHAPIALEIARGSLTQDDPRLWDALESLAQLRIEQRRLPEAERLIGELEAMIASASGDRTRAAEVLSLAGYAQSLAGRSAEAEATLRRALAELEQLLGVEHRQTLVCMTNLGMVLWNEGRFDEAAAYVETLVEIHERVDGADHPSTLTARNNRASLLTRRGKRSEALSERTAILAVRRRVMGDDSPETLASMRDVAGDLRASGDYAAAEVLARESVERARKVFGAEHVAYAEGLRTLGLILWQTGRAAEAEQPLIDGVAASSKSVGPKHERTLDIRNVLAIVRYQQGRYDDALADWQQLYEAEVERAGADDGSVQLIRGNIAMVYGDLGRFDEAERTNLELLETLTRTRGREDTFTQNVLNNLGTLYIAMGRQEDARRMLSEVVEIRERRLGPNNPLTLSTLENLGSVLNGLGRYDDALRTYESVLAARREALAPDHPDLAKALTNVGMVEWHLQRLADGERHERAALDIFARTDGNDESAIADAWQNLGLILADANRGAEAVEALERACEMRERTLGAESPTALRALWALSEQLAKVGRLDDARSRYRELIDALERDVAGPDASATALHQLGSILIECPLEDLRRPIDGLDCARRANALTKDSNAKFLALLARALRATGAEDEALAAAQRALDATPVPERIGKTIEDVFGAHD